MTFSKVLIDTNVCLDAALFRKPFASTALKIFEVAEEKSVDLLISAHTFDTIFYILRQDFSIEKTYKLIRELRSASRVSPVNQPIIDEAISLKWPDFEDAIHYLSAVHTNCDAIVTPDPSGFDQSSIPVFSPFDFLVQLEN
ncbi:MAG: hypothetical protein CL666_13485 [Balneola sp.]|nr:hypothetical protein [Balneola sp.]|tara:strand:+ start:29805 stop:30227 length:423 start_codon:yes stop_codon:yes gene_type:complete